MTLDLLNRCMDSYSTIILQVHLEISFNLSEHSPPFQLYLRITSLFSPPKRGANFLSNQVLFREFLMKTLNIMNLYKA